MYTCTSLVFQCAVSVGGAAFRVLVLYFFILFILITCREAQVGASIFNKFALIWLMFSFFVCFV